MTANIDVSVWIAVIALGVQILVAVTGAVWVIAQIKGTTQSLNGSLSQLSKSIEKLDTSMDRHEERQTDHEIRLQLLERPNTR